MSEKLIDAKELGEQLDLPLQSVWKLARENKVPHYLVGQLMNSTFKMFWRLYGSKDPVAMARSRIDGRKSELV